MTEKSSIRLEYSRGGGGGMITLKNAWLFIASSLLALVITACGDSKKPEVTQAQIDSRLIYMSKENMKHRMKDPESTEFRDVFVSRIADGPVVCGEVNSKNSFGGYTGFQRFISAADINVVKADMKAGEMEKTWQQLCGN